MSDVDLSRCRRAAEQCRSLAAKTVNPVEKDRLHRKADEWLKLARALIFTSLVGGSSFAMAQTAGGSSGGGAAASGSAATGSAGYAGSTLSTGHTISGTAGSSAPNAGNAISQDATGDAGASSVAEPPTSHDNAVNTPAAKDATNSLGNTDTGILKK